MRQLKELKLPQMVEARKKDESSSSPKESPIPAGHSHQYSQSSTASNMSSPTFSARGHSRMLSSTSSLPSSPTMLESDGFGSGKRPLTDVKEEPLERDEDFEMIDSFKPDDVFRDTPSPRRLSQQEWSLDSPEVMRYIEYDLTHEPDDSEYPRNPNAKRQRPDLSPLSGLASKMGSRMPSISRNWRSRKASPAVSLPPLSREASVSRANSTRAPSIISAHGQPPPTPAVSVRQDSSDPTLASSSQMQEVEEREHHEWEDPPKPSTPLLPPLMTEHVRNTKEETYSPLQSPSVADPSLSSPVDATHSPQDRNYPSPPLSAKPSMASVHARQYGVPPLIPSSEIPTMHISGPRQDKWADILGHANFTINPEPYTPEEVSLETCRKLRADWDIARNNFAKHLMRVKENTGPTSRIHTLTLEKWAEIDATWKKTIDNGVAQLNTVPVPSAPGSPVVNEPVGRELVKTPPLVKIPALDGPSSEGKFPCVGDEGIVGPMEVGPVRIEVIEQQEREQQALNAKRKRKLGNYIKDWILGVGMFGKGQQGSWP